VTHGWPQARTKAPYPGFIEPALATPIDKVPSGKRWLHEIKFDGYRVQLHLANNEIKVYTRRSKLRVLHLNRIARHTSLLGRIGRAIQRARSVIHDLLGVFAVFLKCPLFRK
jgi:hypothetical protein